MTVYVDDMHRYPMGRFRGMRMSHMVADTDEELHAMADKIGMKRRWFQDTVSGPHYDVSLSKRQEAVKFGAVEITLRQCAAMSANRRHGAGLGDPATAEAVRMARYWASKETVA